MTPNRQINSQNILSGKATTGVGTTFDCGGLQHVLLQVATASSGNLTIKINGSLSAVAPDFATTATATNTWTTISFVNLTSGSTVAGGTGLAFAGTDGTAILRVNTTGLTFLTVEVTARSAGSVTVNAVGFTNA